MSTASFYLGGCRVNRLEGTVRPSILFKELLTGLFEGFQIKGLKEKALSAFV
jgi:hypothetical protein